MNLILNSLNGWKLESCLRLEGVSKYWSEFRGFNMKYTKLDHLRTIGFTCAIVACSVLYCIAVVLVIWSPVVYFLFIRTAEASTQEIFSLVVKTALFIWLVGFILIKFRD